MFLVKDERFGTTWLVFTYEDPRKDGYKGCVEEDVSLVFETNFATWADGESRPEAPVGKDPANPKHYKVFKYIRDLQTARFNSVSGTPLVFVSWLHYVQKGLVPPDPVQIDEVQWYDYLDNLDIESRRLRKQTPWPEAPNSTDRDEVAEWVAKRHFIGDKSIREIWYLPQGAPPNEIRLLELSEMLLSDESPKVQAMDFGLDVKGEKFQLFVADVTSDQLEGAKKDPSRLPTGWSFDENRIWRRRGA